MANVKDLTISIIDAGLKWYKLAPQSKVLGRMYDNKATNLVFVRPASEVASSLRINFLVGTTEMGSIDIGTADEYEIPSVLTQSDSLTIGVTFVDTDYVKNSEMKTFEILEAAEPQDFVPTPIDDQWLELFGEAVRYTEQTKTDGEKLIARTNIGASSTAIVDGKLDRVDTGSINQVYGVNESNEQVMVEIETAPVSESTKLVTSDGIATALSSYALKANVLLKDNVIPFTPFIAYDPATKKYVDDSVNKAIIYKGLWDSTAQTDYSSLYAFRPIQAGWRWEVSGTGATIGGVQYKAGDFITFNQGITVYTPISTSMIDKTDNTDLVTSVNGEVGDVVLGSEDIAYDNDISGLLATEVKTAIDELDSNIENLEDLDIANTSTIDEIADKTNQKEVNGHFANNGTFNYLAIRTYSENEIVKYAGNFYKSLQNENIGNQPDTATTYWEVIGGGGSAPSEYWVDYAVVPSGTGTTASPYLIYTAEELAWSIEHSGDYRLMSNINLKGKQWTPISTGTSFHYPVLPTKQFTISGLTILNYNEDDCGFFARYARINYVIFEDVTIYSNANNVGVVSGYDTSNGNFMHDITVKSGIIFGNNNVGGFIGLYNGNSGDKDGLINSGVTVVGNNNVGGICGFNNYGSSPKFVEATNYADVWGNDYVGGIIGYSVARNNDIENLLNTGNITGNNYVNGIGYYTRDFNFKNVANFGNIKGNTYVSGIAHQGTIYNSISAGNVSGVSQVSMVSTKNSVSVIQNVLVLGKLNATSSFGVFNYTGTPTITNSYYLENTVNGTNDATGLDRTVGELQRKSTFVGWDFDTTPVWNLNVSETGFNVPMLEVFKNSNLKQPEYYTAVYNAWFNYSRNTYNQTSIVTLTNPTAESIFNGGFGNRIIPANTLRVGDKYLIKVKGTYTATATPTNTLTLSLGGVTLAESVASIANATDETFQWDMTLAVNDIGATGEVVGCGIALGTTGGSTQNSLAGRQIPKVSPAPVIDTTVDNAVEILYTSGSTILNVECILIERIRVA